MAEPFTTLALDNATLNNLSSLGFVHMTPIQHATLPISLEGQDLIAQAKTGSGKTVAFGIDVITRLNVKLYDIQALLICPTRELAEQVAAQLRLLARHIPNVKILTLCGGVPLAPQRDSLKHGAHIIVGTPGRILDHLGKNTLHLEHVHTLVLDEADRMIELGFFEDVTSILTHVPTTRQTLLFSATYPDEIAHLSATLMQTPKHIRLQETTKQSIDEHFFQASGDKIHNLLTLLYHYTPASAIIFCNMKVTCSAIVEALAQHNVQATALHGDLQQLERTQTLVRFANGSINLLVATDVAARGLDIHALDAVINFEMPINPEVYLHRIGRTGRAAHKGLALTLCEAERSQQKALELYEAYANTTITPKAIKAQRSDPTTLKRAPFETIEINGGKKQKLRAGDIVGALTKNGDFSQEDIGKIVINQTSSYVAITHEKTAALLRFLGQHSIKKRTFRARVL